LTIHELAEGGVCFCGGLFEDRGDRLVCGKCGLGILLDPKGDA